jgi:radical S-adenosyl methionine domain-containing protein 2
MKTFKIHHALPGTINLFINSRCNFACKHCYATFLDISGAAPARLEEAQALEIIHLISLLPPPPGHVTRKITFVGGEPTLCPFLSRLVVFAKQRGLATCMVTNGLNLTPSYLEPFTNYLDWVGLSIDALNPQLNRAIGRARRNGLSLDDVQYLERVSYIKAIRARLKINTVVTALNRDCDFTHFIRAAAPLRWKLLQVMSVPGQNDQHVTGLEISRPMFDAFVQRHHCVSGFGVELISEPVDDIRGSYAMISPDGRFFDSSQGHHTYSRPILQVGVEAAFLDVAFDARKYERRGGDYDPFTAAVVQR